MTPCIATLTLSGDLAGKIAAAAQAGFRTLELVEADYLASGMTPGDVRARLADAGLGLTALQPCRDVEGLSGPARERAFARAVVQMDLAAALGADMLLICSQTRPDATPDRDAMAADLAELADLAAARGLRLGYEALSWGAHIATHSAAWDVVRRANHPQLGLVLDSFHTLATQTPYADIAHIPPGRIFLVQLSDAPRINTDILHLSRHLRRLPCLGAHDLVGFMAAVAQTGYVGPLSVEVFSDQLRATPAMPAAQDAALSLAALRAQMGDVGAPTNAGDLAAVLMAPLGPHLTRLFPDGPPGMDHALLCAPKDRVGGAMLGLTAATGAIWSDLPDLPHPDGPVHLSQTRLGGVPVLVAQGQAAIAPPLGPPFAGFGLDSLCFASPDILATARLLRAAGLDLAPVPPDHLDLRGADLGLAQAEVGALRAAQVHLDCDAGGEFRQIFLQSPLAGVWISFAERRGAYAGFGLGTAPIWLSSRGRGTQNSVPAPFSS